jgi:hypothetical protein
VENEVEPGEFDQFGWVNIFFAMEYPKNDNICFQVIVENNLVIDYKFAATYAKVGLPYQESV